MAADMKPEQVPAELVEVAYANYSMHGEGLVHNILAAVLPAHERMVREQVAQEVTERAGASGEFWVPAFRQGLLSAADTVRGGPVTTTPTKKENNRA